MALVAVTQPITLNSEPLLSLTSALRGTLFLGLSAEALTTWDAETLTICHVNRRSAASIEAHGSNAELFLQEDARLAVVLTTQGSLLTYALYQDLENGLLKLRDTSGVVKSWTKHKQTIHIAAEALAVCATPERLYFSTKSPPTVQMLHWQASKKGKAQTVSAELSSIGFLQEPTCTLLQIADMPAKGLQAWRTSEGRVYLVKIGDEDKEPFSGELVGESSDRFTALLIVGDTLCLGDDKGTLRTYQVAELKATRQSKMSFPAAIVMIHNADDGLLVCAGRYVYSTTLQGVINSSHPQAPGQTVWLNNQLLMLHYHEAKLTVTRHARVLPGSSSARPILQRPEKLLTLLSSSNSDEAHLHTVSPPDQAVPHIECASVSVGGRYVAVAGGGRLAHCSTRSGVWKVQAAWDETFHTVWLGWYLHMLIVAGTSASGVFEIRLFSREMPLSQALYVHTLDEPGECFCLQTDILLMATKDSLCSWRITVHKTTQIRLDPLWRTSVKHEAPIRSFSLLETISGTISAGYILEGQTLKLIRVFPAEQVTLLQNVDWFRHQHEKGPFQHSLWAVSAGKLYVWQSPSTHVEPLMAISLDVLPLSLSFEKGTIYGLLRSSSGDGDMFVEPGARLQRQSYVPALFCALVAASGDGFPRTASELLHTLKRNSDFPAVLELILFLTLEEHPLLLGSVWRVLSTFKESVGAVSRLARKVEAKLWPSLFDAVGPPQDFFHVCLDQGELDVAGSFLIVMSTLEEGKGNAVCDGYEEASLLLLSKAAQAGQWDLAAELLKFMTASLNTQEERIALREHVKQRTGIGSAA